MTAPRMNKIIRSRMSERLLITDRALMTLRSIVQVSMLINVFLLANEVFKEFYSGNLHVASSKYLFLGLHGHHALVPWIWTAIAFNLVAMVLLVLPVSRSLKWLNLTCVLCIVGIWIEKGHGAGHPRVHPHAAGRDGRIPSFAQRDPGLLRHLGFWPALLHGLPAHVGADPPGPALEGQ